MGRLRNAFRATLTQQGFELLSMVISFVAVPLYLVHLGAERYGLFLTAQAWAGYLGFGNAGISQSTMILVSHASGRDDPAELARIVRTSLVLSVGSVSLVLVVTLAGLYALSQESIASALKLTHPEVPGLVLAVGLQVVAALAFSTFYDLLIGLQRMTFVSVLQGANRLISQVASLVVTVVGGTVGQVTAASAVVTIAIGLVCAAQARRLHPAVFARSRVTWAQMLLQLKTGAKSFGLQIGATFSGTAPTLALATIVGPAAVPLFAVPARLLAVGTGLVSSFAALLQPAFGEAYARGDLPWIRTALSQVWEKTLLLLGLVAAALLGVGAAFISVWTAGRLLVPESMLVSVAIVGCVTAAIAPIKYVLSGINQHKRAALIEISNGLLALVFAPAAVRLLSANWVGIGVLAASVCTSLWMLPAQARLHLGMARIVPSAGTLLKLALCAVAVYGTARLTADASDTLLPGHPWATLLLSTAGAGIACILAITGLRLVAWRDLYRTLRTQGT